MKKIMIALAAVAMAAVSQAAQVNWNSGKILDSTGVAPTAGAITAYVWNITSDAYSTYAAMDAETLSKTIAAAYKDGSLGSAEASLANTYSSRAGALANVTGTSQFSAGDKAYGLILYVDAAADMYMANVAVGNITSTQNATVANLANVIGGGTSGTATAWAAVPEPTSGLLLLLGMAGLALKRKRA